MSGPCATISSATNPPSSPASCRVFLKAWTWSARTSPAPRACSPRAYNLPVEDCTTMIGKDGGIIEGDAHLTNYRETQTSSSTPSTPPTSKSSGTAPPPFTRPRRHLRPVPAAKVKAAAVLAKTIRELQGSARPLPAHFQAGHTFQERRSGNRQILTKSVINHLRAQSRGAECGVTIPASPTCSMKSAKLAGAFGNAYVVIEGNTDATGKASYHRTCAPAFL